jgi:chemotaxis protein CheC
VSEIEINEFQKDALKEIGNICAGNAATALSQLFERKIDINVPKVLFLPLEKVPSVVGGEEKLVVGLLVKILGDFPSVVLLVFSYDDAKNIASFMVDKAKIKRDTIGKFERSALQEIGVILANAYLEALTAFVRWGLVPRVPQVIEDMAGAMIDAILIELSDVSDYALLIKSDIKGEYGKVLGNFFLIPNPDGLKLLLDATKY